MANTAPTQRGLQGGPRGGGARSSLSPWELAWGLGQVSGEEMVNRTGSAVKMWQAVLLDAPTSSL